MDIAIIQLMSSNVSDPLYHAQPLINPSYFSDFLFGLSEETFGFQIEQNLVETVLHLQ